MATLVPCKLCQRSGKVVKLSKNGTYLRAWSQSTIVQKDEHVDVCSACNGAGVVSCECGG
jgi:hypothetical protein